MVSWPLIKQKIRYDQTPFRGLRIILQDQVHWLHKVAWFLIFLCGIIFSAHFCRKIWQKWEDQPIVTSQIPINNNQFPAVTICNVNKLSKKKLENALSTDPRFEDLTLEKLEKTLSIIFQLNLASDEREVAHFNNSFQELNVTSDDLFEIINKTLPTCKDMVMDCSFGGDDSLKCDDFSSLLPTKNGMCCVFNGPNYSDPDLGIHFASKVPLMAKSYGHRYGLSLVLDAAIEDYSSIIDGNHDGFKILIDAPDKYHEVADRGLAMSPGREMFIGIRRITSDVSNDVVDRTIKQKCKIIEDDSQHQRMRYNQSGCIIDCAARLTQEQHKCRLYFLLKAIPGTPLCDFEIYQNVSKLYDSLRSDPEKAGKSCDCPPPCTDEWFETAELSYSIFPGRGFRQSSIFQRLSKSGRINTQDDTYLKTNVAIINVFFKDVIGVGYKVDVGFGLADFIAAIGGLLSLGLGLSFITLVECIYFSVQQSRRPLSLKKSDVTVEDGETEVQTLTEPNAPSEPSKKTPSYLTLLEGRSSPSSKTFINNPLNTEYSDPDADSQSDPDYESHQYFKIIY